MDGEKDESSKYNPNFPVPDLDLLSMPFHDDFRKYKSPMDFSTLQFKYIYISCIETSEEDFTVTTD